MPPQPPSTTISKDSLNSSKEKHQDQGEPLRASGMYAGIRLQYWMAVRVLVAALRWALC